jgi:hypothetical protein
LSEEQWRIIKEFPRYEISDEGNIYNTRRRIFMRTSLTPFGHVKITLTDYDGKRYDRSVAQLVAEAFVRPPTLLCDAVIVLDGDFQHVDAENLMWRPRHYAWRYTHQLKTDQPRHFTNLPVRNILTHVEYESIMEAGMNEGLLFTDIWRSTYSGNSIFPEGSIFEIINRV